jgi:peptide-methionine (S)-S-oxide reductase
MRLSILWLLLVGSCLMLHGMEVKKETVTLGGGCFWCLEAVFQQVDGVEEVTSGYAGGNKKNPTYEEVCSGRTGHAEVVKIQFDPDRTSLESILALFWQVHDPTTLNRQGADVGTQYRSILLYNDEKERAIFEKAKQEAQKHWPNPIVTEITALGDFYPAENYHQDFFINNPSHPYVQAVVRPKVDKARKILNQ